jgi:microcystin-dependent protein
MTMRRVFSLTAALALAGLAVSPNVARAQFEPYLGQMMLTAGSFCPRGWVAAEGQIVSIASNTSLFQVLGTTYGGNGFTTFALPDLRGRAPIGAGQGPGLSNISLGEVGGAEAQTLTINQMPAHTHQAFGSNAPPVSLTPGNMEVATQDRVRMYAPPGAEVAMAPQAIGVTGGSQPFSTRSPYLGMRWCIALEGIFPSED